MEYVVQYMGLTSQIDRCIGGRLKDHVLIFVPGILGTALHYEGPGPNKDHVSAAIWSEDASVLWQTLTKTPQWLQLRTELKVGAVLRKLRVFPNLAFEPVYAPVLDFFTQDLGYVPGIDFVAFGYDWRQSNRITANRLAELIRRKIREGFRKVKLVAHSMGGLSIRLLLLDSENSDIAGSVDLVVQIGTPVRGSPRAFLSLKKRPQFGRICDLILGAASHVSPETHHELLLSLNTFPSLYELLPHEPDQVLVTRAGDQFSALDSRAWPLLNDRQLQEVKLTHEAIRMCPGACLSSVYSIDVNTEAFYLVDSHFTEPVPWMFLSGDGTVLVASAALGAADIQCHAIEGGVQHQDLPNCAQVLALLRQKLT